MRDSINISKEEKNKMVESIKNYFIEELDQQIGDLKATLLLDFVLQEIAPSVYNRAIADAMGYMHERTDDLSGSCYKAEFNYWKK